MTKNFLTLDSLEQIIAAPDMRQTAEVALAALKNLTPGHYYSAASFHVSLERSSFEMYLPQQGWLDRRHPAAQKMVQQVEQNPFFRQYVTQHHSTVLFRSQMIADRDWQRSDYYQECHRPLGIEDLGAFFLNTTEDRVIVLTCGRDRNFSERDMRPFQSFHRILGALPRFRPDAARPCRPSVSPLTSLSAREKEILHWVRAGKRDAEIGIILGISSRTVHHHLQKIYFKLDVETRTAAAFVQ